MENLMVWCLSLRKTQATLLDDPFPRTMDPIYDTALLEAPPEKPLAASIHLDRGYRAFRMIIGHRNHLDTATSSIVASLTSPPVSEYKRLVVLINPFWYKAACYAAITQAKLWSKVTAIEASSSRIHLDAIGMGKTLLELPAGLIVGETFSLRSKQRPPESHRIYVQMPRLYRYLDSRNEIPITRLTQAEEERFIPRSERNVDWASFKDDTEDDL